jgi:hypothetical protein
MKRDALPPDPPACVPSGHPSEPPSGVRRRVVRADAEGTPPELLAFIKAAPKVDAIARAFNVTTDGFPGDAGRLRAAGSALAGDGIGARIHRDGLSRQLLANHGRRKKGLAPVGRGSSGISGEPGQVMPTFRSMR